MFDKIDSGFIKNCFPNFMIFLKRNTKNAKI